MRKLILTLGNATKDFPIQGEMTIGRQPDNAIQINEPMASRKHARVFISNNEIIVEDMKSANGIEVNGKKITRHSLKNGDKITIGATLITFFDDTVDALSAATDKGQVPMDPLFAATITGGPAPALTLPAHPPAPAPNAAPDPIKASVPIKVQARVVEADKPVASGAGAKIIPPKSNALKNLLILLVIGAAAGGAYVVLNPTVEEAVIDYAPVDALLKDKKYKEAQDRIKTLLNSPGLKEQDKTKLTKKLADTKVDEEVLAIKALINEKGDYEGASKRAQDAINKFEANTDVFVGLSKTAFAADFIISKKKSLEPKADSYEEASLEETIKDLDAIISKFTENQDNLKSLSAVRDAYQDSEVLAGKLKERYNSLVMCTTAWKNISTARQTGQWAKEVDELKKISSCVPDVVERISGGFKADFLLNNAKNFQVGYQDYNSGNYDSSNTSLAAVEKGDFHYQLAQDYLEKIRLDSDYREGLRRYKAGNGKEALEVLKNAKTEKSLSLRSRVMRVTEKLDEMAALSQASKWEAMAHEADALLNTMDKQGDGIYFEQVSALLKSGREHRVEEQYNQLETLYTQRKYGELNEKVKNFLTVTDAKLYSAMVTKAKALQKRMSTTVLEDCDKWVKEARKLWETYQSSPINLDERTSEKAVLPSYVRKVELLTQAFEPMYKAKQAAEILSERDARGINDLYEAIRGEIVSQSEKIFVIRTSLNQLGNFDAARISEQKILLLPNVPGNQWYGWVKDNKK